MAFTYMWEYKEHEIKKYINTKEKRRTFWKYKKRSNVKTLT